MTRRTYICNFCHSEFSRDDADKVLGVHFKIEASNGKCRTVWERRAPWDCETHICKECLVNAFDYQTRLDIKAVQS